MKTIVGLFFCLGTFSACLFGETATLESDGVHYMSEKYPVSPNGNVYEISGSIEASGVPYDGVYITVGFVPLNDKGDKLNAAEEFPLPTMEDTGEGFLTLAQFIIESDGTTKLDRKVAFDGDGISAVSFVADTCLAPGSKLVLKDLALKPAVTDVELDSEGEAGGAKKDTGKSDSHSYAYVGDKDVISGKSVAEKSALADKEATSNEVQGRIIYVDPEIGSDNFPGLRRSRGQVDGPKRTIKAALRKAKDGDVVVLFASDTAQTLDALRAKSGQNVKIKVMAKRNVKVFGK